MIVILPHHVEPRLDTRRYQRACDCPVILLYKHDTYSVSGFRIFQNYAIMRLDG